MSRHARLGGKEALELLDSSEVEEDWSISEDEDDGDDMYLPDSLEIAQKEGNDEQSLHDSDIQETQIVSDT